MTNTMTIKERIRFAAYGIAHTYHKLMYDVFKSIPHLCKAVDCTIKRWEMLKKYFLEE